MKSVGELTQDVQNHNAAAAATLFQAVREPYAGTEGLHQGIYRTQGITDFEVGHQNIIAGSEIDKRFNRHQLLGDTAILVQESGILQVNVAENAHAVGLGIRFGDGIFHVNTHDDQTLIAVHSPSARVDISGFVLHPDSQAQDTRLYVPANRQRDHASWATSAIGINATEGVTITNESAEYYGYQVLGRAITGIFQFASCDTSQEAINRLRNPEQEVWLPKRNAGRHSSMLTLQSHDDNSHVVRFSTVRDEYALPVDILFSLQDDGTVRISEGSINDFMSPGDAEYRTLIKKTDEQLTHYLKRLGLVAPKQSTDIIAAGILDIRRALGARWFARSAIKQAAALTATAKKS